MTKEELLKEVRYSERLCTRTARLYRHLQTAGTTMSIIGGSAVVVGALQPSIAPIGAAVVAVFGAALIAVRPADKAAVNEVESRKYAKLRTEARDMNPEQLETALNKTRESDVAEVEALRFVAYNDLADEIGQPSYKYKLTALQKLVGALA